MPCPPLPPRLHTGPLTSEAGSRLPSGLGPATEAAAAGHPSPGPQFPGLDPSNLAALSAGYPRLGGGMMGLGAAMPGLPSPYSSSEQNPYSSISMENFYSPLVSQNNHTTQDSCFLTLFFYCRPTPTQVLKKAQVPRCRVGRVAPLGPASRPPPATTHTTRPPWLPMDTAARTASPGPGRM